jgi:uncharacterized membrane protein YvbJ
MGVRNLEASHIVGGIMKWCGQCGKSFGDSSKNKNRITDDLATPLPGAYAKDLKGTWRDT